MDVGGQARTQKQRMPAVSGAQGIDRLVEVGEPLHAHHFPEQIELAVIFSFGQVC
jgi:hypothetical protein